jgi:uncharacterized protein YjbI with pentapeptide repeats
VNRLKGILIPALVMAALLIAASGSMAYTREDLEKIKITKSCEACNLRGAVLVGLSLPGANLAGSDLTGANLTNADLRGANFRGARMVDVGLTGANLTGADFSGAVWIDGSTCMADSIGKCLK